MTSYGSSPATPDPARRRPPIALIVGLFAGPGPFAIDATLLLALRRPGDLGVPIGPAWLLPAMRDITAIGGPTVLTLLVLAATGFLLVTRRRRTALLLIAATTSGAGLVVLVKDHVGRARPAIVPHLVEVTGQSFPSGHSTDSAVVYLTMAALATRAAGSRAARAYLVGLAVLLVGAIGISRVYLGVHWPSDVATGWSVGTLWALAWWRIGAAWDGKRAVGTVTLAKAGAHRRSVKLGATAEDGSALSRG